MSINEQPGVHYIGDTFMCSGVAEFPLVTDFTGWVGQSMLRYTTPGTPKLVDLVFAWVDAVAGSWTLTFAGSTNTWYPGPAIFDIKFTLPGGGTERTEPVPVTIMAGATYG